MAKLNGVKTLDMVGGEITKVAYDGAEYVKVSEGNAQKGDIAEIMKPWGSQIKGAFYRVIQEDHQLYGLGGLDAGIVFIDGETTQASEYLSHVKLFRKVTAEQPQATNFRKVTGRAPKAGDFVMAETLRGMKVDVTAGKYYELFLDTDDNLCFFDDVQDERYLDGYEKGIDYDVYEKVTEIITHNGAEYTLVDRKAQAGDVVVFTETNSAYLTNGKVYGPVNGRLEVVDNDGDELDVYFTRFNRTPANVKVFAPKVEPLKVGDYAKVISHDYDMPVGTIVNITEIDDYESRPKGVLLTAVNSTEPSIREYNYFYPKDLTHATDAEVAEAKRKVAEEEARKKWAAIGRKPNEFKEGDIVRIIKSDSSQPNGEIGEISEVDGVDFRVSTTTRPTKANWQGAECVELITPVEARFDRE